MGDRPVDPLAEALAYLAPPDPADDVDTDRAPFLFGDVADALRGIGYAILATRQAEPGLTLPADVPVDDEPERPPGHGDRIGAGLPSYLRARAAETAGDVANLVEPLRPGLAPAEVTLLADAANLLADVAQGNYRPGST